MRVESDRLSNYDSGQHLLFAIFIMNVRIRSNFRKGNVADLAGRLIDQGIARRYERRLLDLSAVIFLRLGEKARSRRSICIKQIPSSKRPVFDIGLATKQIWVPVVPSDTTRTTIDIANTSAIGHS